MFSRLKIRTKLLAAFSLVALGALLVGAVGFYAVSGVTRSTAYLSGNVVPSLEGVDAMAESFVWMRFYAVKAVVDPSTVEALWASREQARLAAEKGLAQYDALPRDEHEEALWTKIVPGFRAYLEENARIFEAVRARDAAKANAQLATIAARFETELVQPLKALAEMQVQIGEQQTKNADAVAQRGTWLLTVFVTVTFVAALGLGVWLAFSITRPLVKLTREAGTLRDAVVAGQLRARGDVAGIPDEFRPIVEGMNETMEAFAKPLAMTVEYVTRTSKGDIPPLITDEYRGDFNQIKDAFNTCIDAVNALVADAGMLAGRRGGPARHPGRRLPAPGGLQQGRPGRERHARRGRRAAQRGREAVDALARGGHPRQASGRLPRRLRRSSEEEPQQLHRGGEPARRRRRQARPGGGGGAALPPGRTLAAPGGLPRDRGGRERYPRRGHRAVNVAARTSTSSPRATSPPRSPTLPRRLRRLRRGT